MPVTMVQVRMAGVDRKNADTEYHRQDERGTSQYLACPRPFHNFRSLTLESAFLWVLGHGCSENEMVDRRFLVRLGYS
jgi:hypothetical protein